MAKHLKQFSVAMFRGISDLNVENTSDINILVGDNNIGKTSVLEALMLLRNPEYFINTVNVARLRDTRNFYSPFRVSNYESFLSLFSKNSYEKMQLQVEGKLDETSVSIKINGTVEKVMVDLFEIEKHSFSIGKKSGFFQLGEQTETPMFVGKYTALINNKTHKEQINFGFYSSVTGNKVRSASIRELIYTSPTEHTSGNIFNKVIRTKGLKESVIKILQTFDKNIVDLLILKNEQTNIPVEYINHKKLGNMPISTYGDGIKKVILIADKIARAADGILLIDEIETAIHAKSYETIFSFIIKACKEFNVQLFATTHSIEALDAILKTQYSEKTGKYDGTNKDLIRIITLRKDKRSGKTLSRVLSGAEVFKNRENFGFEVRI